MKRKLVELDKKLAERESLPLGDSAQELIRHCNRWGPPIQPQLQAGLDLDDRRLKSAIDVHNHYQEVKRTVDDLVKLNPDGDEFERDLKHLRNQLEKALDHDHVPSR